MAETETPRTRKKREALKADQEAEWRKKLDQGKKPPRAYAMDQVYKLDERVEHQSFGIGLVVDLIHPDKVNVFFEDGVKLMRCGREALKITGMKSTS